MPLATLKPKGKTLETARRTALAGDERIRGNALQKIRERILSRDCGVCQCDRCKASGDIKLATIVDHRVPLWEGGRESDENRQAINVDCHKIKSDEEAKRRAAAQRRG